MGKKSKSRRKNEKRLTEKLSTSKLDEKKKKAENPFEIRFNKQKHNVLGRRLRRDEKGKPGVARSRATHKRNATLLVEYKRKYKDNKLVDRRLGEYDANMTPEEKMMERFAMEHTKRNHDKSKSKMFSLAEEEDLTHYGQSLADIEKFEDVRSDSDDDEQGGGGLSAEYVSDLHFGGGLLNKIDEEVQRKKSKSEILEEMITRTRQLRYEKQREKESASDATTKMDEQWKELRKSIDFSSKKVDETENDEMKGKSDADNYDQLVRQLHFESKAHATDRLKSEEELAKEEKEKLEELEQARQRRMLGLQEGGAGSAAKSKSLHSADSLDDDFQLVSRGDEDAFICSYKDGRLLQPDTGAEDKNDESTNEQEVERTGDAGDAGDDEEDEDDDEESDDFSDIASDSNISGDGCDSGDDCEQEKDEKNNENVAEPSSERSLLSKKEAMEAAKKELPYTFPAPADYQELVGAMAGVSVDNQLVVIERIRKCHHTSLAEENKEKMKTLLVLLLQYMGDVAVDGPAIWTVADMGRLLDGVTAHITQLSRLAPFHAAKTVRTLLQDKMAELQACLDEGHTSKCTPGLSTLLLLKLVSVLFSTSDKVHSVVTPAMLFTSQLLTQCRVKNRKEVAAGLFLSTLFLEWVTYSKRFVPEVINFIRGVMFLTLDKGKQTGLAVVPPFKSKTSNFLFLDKICKTLDPSPLSIIGELGGTTVDDADDKFKIDSTFSALQLLREFSHLYEQLPAFPEIFSPIGDILERFPSKNYPHIVQALACQCKSQLTKHDDRLREFRTAPKPKPKSIQFLTPKFDETFDGRKKRNNKNKAFVEKQRLNHKYKREMKSAVREVRKDNQFLAQQQLKEQLQRDHARKEKVKRIHSLLANQEGDYKACKKQKPTFTR